MEKLNDLQKIMQTKIKGSNYHKSNIVSPSTAGASAKWLKKHKQTNNGTTYEKI